MWATGSRAQRLTSKLPVWALEITVSFCRTPSAPLSVCMLAIPMFPRWRSGETRLQEAGAEGQVPRGRDLNENGQRSLTFSSKGVEAPS
jgi:hypothetical protein